MAMFQTNGFLPPKRVGARGRPCLVFVFAVLLLQGPAATVANAQDRSLDNLRNLNQSVDALIFD